jgi:hypothetical protein
MKFTVRSDIDRVKDPKEVDKHIALRRAMLENKPLPALLKAWESLPRGSYGPYSRTSYIMATHALTYWVLHSLPELRHDLGNYCRAEGSPSRPSDFPALTHWAPHLRTWLLLGVIPEKSLDKLLSDTGYGSLCLLDQRAWVTTKGYTRLERGMHELENQELAELLDTFEDIGPGDDHWALPRVSARTSKPTFVYKTDQELHFLLMGTTSKGGHEVHRRNMHDRVVRRWVKYQETLAMMKLAAQQEDGQP